MTGKVTWRTCGGADRRRQALKHGLSREAILHAFRNPLRAYNLGDGFTMLIGPAPNADLLEVGVVGGTEGPVVVHAMRARRRFLE